MGRRSGGQKSAAPKGAKKTGARTKTTGGAITLLSVTDTAAGVITLLTGLAVSGFLFWHNQKPTDFNEYNLLNTACILWVPLLVVLFLLRRNAEEFGMTPGDVRTGSLTALVLFALFVPVILFAAPTPGSQYYYISWLSDSRALSEAFARLPASGHLDAGRLLYHEVVMGFYMFGWEWYHRGFLLFGLKKWMPTWAAVAVQAVLFMALHWGKPPAEVASSLPGGILMGVLALRFGSFLPCFLLHFLVSAGFDAAVIFFHFRHG